MDLMGVANIEPLNVTNIETMDVPNIEPLHVAIIEKVHVPNIETLHVANIETRRARTSKAAVIEHREAPQVTAVDHRAGDRPSSGQRIHQDWAS